LKEKHRRCAVKVNLAVNKAENLPEFDSHVEGSECAGLNCLAPKSFRLPASLIIDPTINQPRLQLHLPQPTQPLKKTTFFSVSCTDTTWNVELSIAAGEGDNF